jgi:O-antigen/teichoic acid export membrane protein
MIVGLLLLTGLSAIRSAALRGLHRVILGQMPESLILPLLFVIGLVAIPRIEGFTFATADVALMLRLVVTFFAFAVGAMLLAKSLPRGFSRSPLRYSDIGVWFKTSVPFMFLSGMAIINTQTDVLMLAALKGPRSAGIYQAAARGAEVVAFCLVVFNFVLQPTISKLATLGEIAKLERLLTFASRGALVVAVPVALVLSAYGKQILAVFFGPEFVVGATSLMILCAAQVFNAATGSVGQVLNMSGYERDSAIGMCIGAVSNIAFNLLLIPKFGIAGAAVATAMSLMTWNVFLLMRVRKRLGIDPTFMGRRTRNGT